MPSQYHSRKSTQRALLGGPGAQHKAGRSSWGTATAASMPGGFLGTPGAGLWPRGSGSHKQRNPDVSRGTSSSLCRTAGHPTLWKRFPRCRRAELQAQVGEIPAAPSFQGLFSCPACGSSAPVLVGGPFRVFGFSSLLQPKQCVLCQLPSCGVTGSVRSSQTDANPPLQHREEQGCLSPAFSSGFSFWITLTLCLEHASGCTLPLDAPGPSARS